MIASCTLNSNGDRLPIHPSWRQQSEWSSCSVQSLRTPWIETNLLQELKAPEISWLKSDDFSLFQLLERTLKSELMYYCGRSYAWLKSRWSSSPDGHLLSCSPIAGTFQRKRQSEFKVASWFMQRLLAFMWVHFLGFLLSSNSVFCCPPIANR